MAFTVPVLDRAVHKWQYWTAQSNTRGTPMTALRDKVAVVTGANSGIGYAIAEGFVAEGARVFITGRRKPELDQAVEALGVTGVHADSANRADLDVLYRTVREREG